MKKPLNLAEVITAMMGAAMRPDGARLLVPKRTKREQPARHQGKRECARRIRQIGETA